jgi:diguanylate cyclase (GGDEF)-like protein/PAS domain S-box-containing protein
VEAWRELLSVQQLPWIVLGIGLIGTTAICEQNRRHGAEQHRIIESTLRDSVVDAIRSKLETNISILSGIAGFFNGAQTVSRSDFRTFHESVALNTGQLKGVQGVGFARNIPAQRLGDYEAEIRRQGFSGFRVRPGGERPVYSAVEFVEPFDWRNQRAFGFDMTTEPVRKQAMNRAAASGIATLSGKVRLLQETDDDLQRGVLIYVPIYKDRGEATSSMERELVGWAYSPLRMNDMANSAIAGIDNPDMAGTGVVIFDGDRPLESHLLYDNLKLVKQRELSHPSTERLQIGGRTWLIGVQAPARLVSATGLSSLFWINLLIGSGISVIAALVTRILVNNHLATRQALKISEGIIKERAIASTVFEESGQGIVVCNPEGRILTVNSAFCQLTGYRTCEVRGQRTSLLKSGRHDTGFYKRLWDQLSDKGYWEGDLWNRINSGEQRLHHLSVSAVLDENLQPTCFVGMYQDVTERHEAEEAMRFKAQHDPLTGLANRAVLMEQLERDLALARRHGHGLALIYMDLDGFKPVNDQFGHQIGDSVLQIIAKRFSSAIRECDLLCRLGGDEFVVLVPVAAGTAALEAMAWKLVEASRRPFSELEASIKISASVGIARFPDHGDSAEQLLAAADAAMYRAKRSRSMPVQVAAGAPSS